MKIRRGDLDDPRVRALIAHHVASARAATAPGSAHALDLEELRAADVRFWTAWDEGRLVGVGALKLLSEDHGEIKSMHTDSASGAGAPARRCCVTSSTPPGPSASAG